MIINFSVKNFGSIKEKQTLSFVADKSTHLEDAYIIKVGKHRLLKLALIFGANASGKTTVLQALDFLRDIVLDPLDNKNLLLKYEPFLFDEKTPTQSSEISIEFYQNNIRYGYRIEFIKRAILSEELNIYNPKKSNVYTRKSDLSTQYTDISFGSKIKVEKNLKEILEGNTLWNNSVLGGFLKTNIKLQELQETVDWFINYTYPLIYSFIDLHDFVSISIRQKEITIQNVLEILKKADFNISGIKIEEKEITDDFLDFLKRQQEIQNEEIKQIELMKKLKIHNIEIEHTINKEKYLLPLLQESQGTKRYFGFAGLLAILIQKASFFSIDEIESSLHPDLFIHFILTFLLNSKNSQIIATTHYRELLGDKDLFRNDVIWFTDKSKFGSTELYSLSNFDSSVIRDTTNVLNAYKSGKLSGVPKLSDTYVEL